MNYKSINSFFFWLELIESQMIYKITGNSKTFKHEIQNVKKNEI